MCIPKIDLITGTLSANTLEQTPLTVLKKLDELTKHNRDLKQRCEELEQSKALQVHEFKCLLRESTGALTNRRYGTAELLLRRTLTK
jgi:hypothetical protein